MLNGSIKSITDPAHYFRQPQSTPHRQYEALRAYFLERLPAAQVAQRFGYTPGSLRVLAHQFRHHSRDFFAPAPRTPPTAASDTLRSTIIMLRKQNLSIYDISRALAQQGTPRSPVAVSLILQQEGFARLPRRRDEERPAAIRPSAADVADVRQLDVTTERGFRTRFGGLFLFIPTLVALDLPRLLRRADFPGTQQVPADCALRSLLALKLFGNARHSHVMSHVFDEGLAFFAGLNVIPKRSFLTEYSCRIRPGAYPPLMRDWLKGVSQLGLPWGTSFDLDFHTIPFHGTDALLQKHYVSKRSRRQKGVLAFLAQDAQTRVFCYVDGTGRKEDQADQVLAFARYWKRRTGRYPQELIFDSRLTTHAKLAELHRLGIQFITLRRRGTQLLERIRQTPASAWRRIELEGVTRQYRTPRILDQRITLHGYPGRIRQLVVDELGHEDPMILLSNQMGRSAPGMIGRYARRMLIENGIEDAIDFFHMDALSSAVAMKVDCDLQLTLMASSLYRLLGARLGNGYQTAKSRHIFRDIIDATAHVEVGARDIVVQFQKRAHNPLLLAAGFDRTDLRVPWLHRKRLQFVFG